MNLPPKQALEFFGETGDELTMAFDFTVNQALYLSLVREDAGPLGKALKALPELPDDCQRVNFVRNHDELSLDQLTNKERAEVFAALGPDPAMQLYGRGIRRRLPSMLDGDERRIRLVYSLMFSLPGTPALFYGEEIGMSENLDIEGRLSVRSPMQWSGERHAGFSPAPEGARLARPLPAEVSVNVQAQRRDPDSLLNWMERLIRRRKECPELGWGRLALLEASGPVLAHRCDWQDRTIVAVHNLTGSTTTVRLPGDDGWERLADQFGTDDAAPGEELELEPYGHRWFRPG